VKLYNLLRHDSFSFARLMFGSLLTFYQARTSHVVLFFKVRNFRIRHLRIIEQEHTPVAGDRVQCRKEEIVCDYRRATPDEIAHAEHIVAAKQADPHTMLGSLMSELLLDYEKKMNQQGLKSGALPIQVMSIGELLIFALPGELYHQFGVEIKENCPGRKCLIATLSNGAFGYIPVPELFGTCAYPVQLCEGSFWEPSAGNAITDRAIALAAELRG
ncbi:MAG: hypothetical protein VB070_12850, partial [Clostridiaceae bacterium]|nr:hypothetical protein [Clostridiaceae bacterium]